MVWDYLGWAGVINFAAALAHIAVIIGGASWYRFFGAGEAMATMAEQGQWRPTLITLGIAMLLAIGGIAAWSVAGLLPTYPIARWVVVGFCAVYLLRGVVGLIAPFVLSHPAIAENSTTFWVVSSILCIVFGAVHAMGLVGVL